MTEKLYVEAEVTKSTDEEGVSYDVVFETIEAGGVDIYEYLSTEIFEHLELLVIEEFSEN